MSPRHRQPWKPLEGFKQVGKRPPRFECEYCVAPSDDKFIMDHNAMIQHSKLPEHQRREKDLEEANWAGWNAGAQQWNDVDQPWGNDAVPNEDELQRWQATEEESVRWQLADEKHQRLMRWLEDVELARKELEEERRQSTMKTKRPGSQRNNRYKAPVPPK